MGEGGEEKQQLVPGTSPQHRGGTPPLSPSHRHKELRAETPLLLPSPAPHNSPVRERMDKGTTRAF